jgi:hypothetical protein
VITVNVALVLHFYLEINFGPFDNFGTEKITSRAGWERGLVRVFI